MKSKRWSLYLLVFTLLLLTVLGSITVLIDPFFHFHAPLPDLQYPLEWTKERYLNDGIIKHFDYNAVITGTSMTENFLTSECDELFGVSTIKVPFEGASFTELHNNIRTALDTGKDIKFIICSMDVGHLFQECGEMRYDCPDYMYDRSPLNDAPYLLNKSILFDSTIKVLEYSSSGATTTNFDEYCFWGDMEWAAAGRENAMHGFSYSSEAKEEECLTDEQRQLMIDNFVKDTLEIAQAYPETQFIYFIPPYSILHWANLRQNGQMGREVEAWKIATRHLLEADNIQLFSFYTDYDLITNLDLYKDLQHYAPEVNSLILQYIHDRQYLLTSENYESHWQEVLEFYSSYDYDAIFNHT